MVTQLTNGGGPKFYLRVSKIGPPFGPMGEDCKMYNANLMSSQQQKQTHGIEQKVPKKKQLCAVAFAHEVLGPTGGCLGPCSLQVALLVRVHP